MPKRFKISETIDFLSVRKKAPGDIFRVAKLPGTIYPSAEKLAGLAGQKLPYALKARRKNPHELRKKHGSYRHEKA